VFRNMHTHADKYTQLDSPSQTLKHTHFEPHLDANHIAENVLAVVRDGHDGVCTAYEIPARVNVCVCVRVCVCVCTLCVFV
jgi:adenosine deaminase